MAAEEVFRKYHLARWRRRCRRAPCCWSAWCSRSPRPPSQDWWWGCRLMDDASRRTWRASLRASISTLVALNRQRQQSPQCPRHLPASRKFHCGSVFQEQEPPLAADLPSRLPTRSACPSACTSSTPPQLSPSSWNPPLASTSSQSWRSRSSLAELPLVVADWLQG